LITWKVDVPPSAPSLLLTDSPSPFIDSPRVDGIEEDDEDDALDGGGTVLVDPPDGTSMAVGTCCEADDDDDDAPPRMTAKGSRLEEGQDAPADNMALNRKDLTANFATNCMAGRYLYTSQLWALLMPASTCLGGRRPGVPGQWGWLCVVRGATAFAGRRQDENLTKCGAKAICRLQDRSAAVRSKETDSVQHCIAAKQIHCAMYRQEAGEDAQDRRR